LSAANNHSEISQLARGMDRQTVRKQHMYVSDTSWYNSFQFLISISVLSWGCLHFTAQAGEIIPVHRVHRTSQHIGFSVWVMIGW